jgi:hypothetical protein
MDRWYRIDGNGHLLVSEPDEMGDVRIENSYPKGDRYVNPDGLAFGCAVFWTRISNHSDQPLTLDLQFPAETIPSGVSAEGYTQIFLPPGEMTVAKESAYNYGATELHPFLDQGIAQPTTMQRTIAPGEAVSFYTGALSFRAGGTVRAGIFPKGGELIYRLAIQPHTAAVEIPIGRLSH